MSLLNQDFTISIGDIVMTLNPTLNQVVRFYLNQGGFLKRSDYETYMLDNVRSPIEILDLISQSFEWMEEADGYIIRSARPTVEASNGDTDKLLNDILMNEWVDHQTDQSTHACRNFMSILAEDGRLKIRNNAYVADGGAKVEVIQPEKKGLSDFTIKQLERMHTRNAGKNGERNV